MFNSLRKDLIEGLKERLPGPAAHDLMYPTHRDSSFRLPEFVDPPVKSAVLLLFYQDEAGDIKFPLIQRPNYNGAHSGQISLPGGKYEDKDQTLIQTALRETHEEIGIDPATVEVVGCLTDLHITVSNYLVTPVIGFTEKKPDYIIDPKEVDAVIEADLAVLLDPSCRKHGTVIAGGKFKIQAPYFEIEQKIVWGATAMMLNELCMLLSLSKSH